MPGSAGGGASAPTGAGGLDLHRNSDILVVLLANRGMNNDRHRTSTTFGTSSRSARGGEESVYLDVKRAFPSAATVRADLGERLLAQRFPVFC
jgi:hypothetical protein